MLGVIFSWTVRKRRAVIVGALSAALAWTAAHALGPASLDTPLFYTLSGLILGAVGLLVMTWARRSRPAVFKVCPHPPSFRTPPDPGSVYLALLIIFLATAYVTYDLLPERPGDLSVLAWVNLAVLLVLGGLNGRHAWQGEGIELRPDGLVVREVGGRLTIPWPALAAGSPGRPDLHAATLELRYARRDLVRRRGLIGRRRIFIDSIHPWFIADALRHYVGHPEHRAAIGTATEYERLRRALHQPPG